MSKHAYNHKLSRTNAVFQKILDGSAFTPKHPAIDSLGDIKIEASFRTGQNGYKVAITKAGGLSTHQADTICSRIRLVFPDFTFPAAASSNMIEMLFEPTLTCLGLPDTQEKKFFLWIQELESTTCAHRTRASTREEMPNDILRYPPIDGVPWSEILSALGLNPFVLLTLKANDGSLGAAYDQTLSNYILTLQRTRADQHNQFIGDYITHKLKPYTRHVTSDCNKTQLIISRHTMRPLLKKHRKRLSEANDVINKSGALTKHCTPGNGLDKFFEGLRGEHPKLRSLIPRKGHTIMSNGVRPSKKNRATKPRSKMFFFRRSPQPPNTHRTPTQKITTTCHQSVSVVKEGATTYLWENKDHPLVTWPIACFEEWQIRRIVDYNHSSIHPSYNRSLEYHTNGAATRMREHLLKENALFKDMNSLARHLLKPRSSFRQIVPEILAHLPRYCPYTGVAWISERSKEKIYNAIERAFALQTIQMSFNKRYVTFPIIQHFRYLKGRPTLSRDENNLVLVQAIPDDFLRQKRNFLSQEIIARLFYITGGIHHLTADMLTIISQRLNKPRTDLHLIEDITTQLIRHGGVEFTADHIGSYIQDHLNPISAAFLIAALKTRKPIFRRSKINSLIKNLLDENSTASQKGTQAGLASIDRSTQLILTILRQHPNHCSLSSLSNIHQTYGIKVKEIEALCLSILFHHTYLKPGGMPTQPSPTETYAETFLQHELNNIHQKLAISETTKEQHIFLCKYLHKKFKENEDTELTGSDIIEAAFILRDSLTTQSREAILLTAMNDRHSASFSINFEFIRTQLELENHPRLSARTQPIHAMRSDFINSFFTDNLFDTYSASTTNNPQLLLLIANRQPNPDITYNPPTQTLLENTLFQYMEDLDKDELSALIMSYLNSVSSDKQRIFQCFARTEFVERFADSQYSLATALKFLTLENSQFTAIVRNNELKCFIRKLFIQPLCRVRQLNLSQLAQPHQVDNVGTNIQSFSGRYQTIFLSHLLARIPIQPSSEHMFFTFAMNGEAFRSRGSVLYNPPADISQQQQLRTAKKTIHSLFFNLRNIPETEANNAFLLRTLVSLDRHQFKKAARYLTTIGFGLYSHRLRRRKLAHTLLQAYTFIRNRGPSHYRSAKNATDKIHKYNAAKGMLSDIKLDGTYNYNKHTTLANRQGTLGMLTTILKRQDRGAQFTLQHDTLPTNVAQ